jgi:hypothetical protein
MACLFRIVTHPSELLPNRALNSITKTQSYLKKFLRQCTFLLRVHV